MEQPDVLIIGAGPAGMAAALSLSNAGKKVLVVEKSGEVGGLAKTLTFHEEEGPYHTDIGPHRFYSKNPSLYELPKDLLKDEWIEVPRLTRFAMGNTYYLYPVELSDVLSKIGMLRAAAMLRDALIARTRRVFRRSPYRSFEDYIVSHFGWSLARFNMLPYTEKIWGIPSREISVDWANQRIKGLSILSLLKKAIGTKKKGPASLVDSFYYPRQGSGQLYDRMRSRIEEQGSTVWTHAEPVSFRREGNKITEVIIQRGEEQVSVRAPHVIQSIPLPSALHLFDPSPPQAVLDSAKQLRFRNQVYLFLTVKKDSISKDNWIYFPDPHVPFGRTSEMKNFSDIMVPKGYTSLFIEFFCWEDDEVWTASKERLLELSLPHLERYGLLKAEDVKNAHVFRREHVYPVYDLAYDTALSPVIEFVDSLENFYAIGRPGRFRYTNQDHSLEMGFLAAKSILEGKRYDIGAVGSEQTYYESGKVPEKRV